MGHKNKMWRLCFASIAFMAIITGPGNRAIASSPVDYFDLAPEQLLQTKVLSVSKKFETVADSPAAIYVVTNEDIIRSGVTNIPDALRIVPGVNVARLDSNSWAVSIRGFNSGLANKLLVLIDGRTIYNPVFGGVLWEAHDLMLEDIERIEVIRGPGGALWGANAVNGVINIITKSAADTQGNLASTLAGNEERGTLSARHGGAFGDDGFYRVYGKGFQRDSSRRPEGGNTYDEWDGYRGGFRADWGGQFTLQGDAYRSYTYQRRNHFSLVAPHIVLENQNIKYEGVNLLGRWTDSREDGSLLSIQSYIDWARRDERINFIDNRAIYDLETQYNFAPLGAHEVVVGAGYRFMSDNQKGNENVEFSPQERHNSIYSAFVQDKITLAPEKWFLTLGSKFEHNEFSGFEVQPSARLQWHPDSKQTVWSAVSRAVRTPTPLEDDLTSTLNAVPGVRAAFIPNDNFKSEELTAYELGYRNQITPELSADLAAFYNVYENLATTSILFDDIFIVNNGVDPVHFFLPVQFRNDMKGRTHGFEAALSWAPIQDLKITTNYSYLHMALDSPLDPTQESAEDLNPVHQVGLRSSWNINENWTLDTAVSYVDQLPAADVGDYVRLDVNLGWQINENLRFNLVGQNLVDGSHRELGAANDINAAEIERSIFGKFVWKF
jgi:iron complex outermembrane recepter protein